MLILALHIISTIRNKRTKTCIYCRCLLVCRYYGFFAVHLFITLKFLPNRINTKSILVIASLASASFLIYTVIRNLTSFEFHNPSDTYSILCKHHLSNFRFNTNRSCYSNTCETKRRLPTINSLVAFFVISFN